MKISQLIKSTAAALALAVAFGVSSTTPAFGHEAKGHKKDAAHAATGVPKGYPLKRCVVSDDGFDHGKAVKVTAPDGTDVYLCCKECVKDFEKDPAKYAAMVKDAQHKK